MTDSLHALSGAYVVNALDDAERAAFERHLAQCVDCQHEVASLREATVLMADDAALTPPPALRDSVLAGIKNIRPIPPETGTPTETGSSDEGDSAPSAQVLPMRPRRRRIAALVATAAAVLAIAGGVAVQPWQDDRGNNQLDPADQVLAAADVKQVSVDFEGNAKATVFHSAKERRAVIVTRNMPAPPSGKAYELWLQNDSGDMVPAGLMKKPGDHKLLLKGDAAKATGVGITVEPESGSDEPTTEPIALFELEKADA